MIKRSNNALKSYIKNGEYEQTCRLISSRSDIKQGYRDNAEQFLKDLIQVGKLAWVKQGIEGLVDSICRKN